jgi:hypothetical protein
MQLDKSTVTKSMIEVLIADFRIQFSINTEMDLGIMDEMIWISYVVNANGTTDCELLSSEPKESFIDGLDESFREGRIQSWEIRAGFINGGDSRIEYASHG